ncbi:fimbrial protein [Erwinia sp. S43]|uniref:fimbrial protein n=1 Tax=Erwinia sp. S43 TaxID=2769339 RepID=UPI00190D8E65|nr:fimbrial protein [Erwinia sp. S43]MBK0033473.1 fimbrial protein [Erwinia sp. S43]
MCAWKIAAIAFLFGVCLPGYAVDTGMMTVNFRGRVVDKNPCTINNDEQIIVPFGNISKKDADGVTIKKNLNVSVKCTGLSSGDGLRMKIVGTSDTYDYILDTNMKGMGIVFYKNGSRVDINTWFNLPNPADSLILAASPNIIGENISTGGDFNASATLLINIQ